MSDETEVGKRAVALCYLSKERLAPTGFPLLSEEGRSVAYEERKKWELFWLIDPLDGTKEFISRLDEFTVNIGLVHYQQAIGGVVYIPCQGILYSGSPGKGVYKTGQGNRISIAPASCRKRLPFLLQETGVRIVTSRSHQSLDTRQYMAQFKDPFVKYAGSSLKFLDLLEGHADIYPRMEPSMEWDTAAAHALLKLTNRNIYDVDLLTELLYNKPVLTNPSFVAL